LGECPGLHDRGANLDGSGVDESFIAPGGTPFALAVDGTYIYWSDNVKKRIGRAKVDGSDVNDSFISTVPPLDFLAVDGAHIYWTAVDTIGRANLDGSGVDETFILAPNGGGIAVGP
jgi:hypothetical protein